MNVAKDILDFAKRLSSEKLLGMVKECRGVVRILVHIFQHFIGFCKVISTLVCDFIYSFSILAIFSFISVSSGQGLLIKDNTQVLFQS